MLRPMEIPVAVGQIDRANRAMADLARNTRAVGQAPRGIRFPSPGGGRGVLASPGGLVGGPNYNLARAGARLSALQSMGAPAALVQDAQGAYLRAQASAQRQQHLLSGANQQSPLMRAILTSRFGAGGIQPLVGRTLAAAGLPAAAAGPIGLAVMGFGLAGKAALEFARFVAQAGATAHEFGIAMTLSGGTAAETARLRGMGVGDIAGASGGLRGRLTSDPLAMATAAQLGVGPVLPQAVGSQDNARILAQSLEALRKVTNGEEQLRKARILGLESYLDQIRVSDEVWNRGKRLAALNEQIYSPKFLQAARDLAGDARNLELAQENLRGAYAKPFVGPLGTGIGLAADFVNRQAAKAASTSGQKQITSNFQDFLRGMPGGGALVGLFNALSGGGGSAPAIDPHTTAQQRNTAALDTVAAELSRLNMNIGGGRRTQAALPAGYLRGAAGLFGSGDFAAYAAMEREALRKHAQDLGPFAG